jgi:hypothetical protein
MHQGAVPHVHAQALVCTVIMLMPEFLQVIHN